MKLLFDENLPPALAQDLSDVFPGSAHVHQLDLGAVDDREVWDYARQQGFVIATKDSDFQDLSVLLGHPPKVLWLRTGNGSRASLARLLRDRTIVLLEFETSANGLLILRP